MLFMAIERFKDTAGVYRRFRDKGRMLPDGLNYVDSWVDVQHGRCFQLMESDTVERFQAWIANWRDLIDFEVVEVVKSQEAAALLRDQR
jgi:hypothetical protein